MVQETRTRKPDLATRRAFLARFASGIFASLIAPAAAQGILDQVEAAPPGAPVGELEPPPELPEAMSGQHPVVRMMEDLRRALQKPVEQRRWAMVIDLRKCVGCYACTVACISENKLPPGIAYRPVLTETRGDLPARLPALHPAAVHAVRKPALRFRVPSGGDVEAGRWDRGDQL